MALWSNQDASSNAMIYVAAQVNLTPNTTNRDNIFGNTTPSAFVTGKTFGLFGVDTTEVGVSNGAVIAIEVTSPGSGYFANAAVTVSGGGGASATANAEANASGKVATVHITAGGEGFETSPTVTIDPPAAQSFNASSGVNGTTEFISIASNKFQNGDLVKYLVAAGNTAIAGLTNNTSYYVVSANSTGVKLSLTPGGSAIDITAGLNQTGHSLTGQTATAVATVSSANKGIAHAGWNVRTVGSGGRAGRVHYETLVAMGSMVNTTDAEDTVLPDA